MVANFGRLIKNIFVYFLTLLFLQQDDIFIWFSLAKTDTTVTKESETQL